MKGGRPWPINRSSNGSSKSTDSPISAGSTQGDRRRPMGPDEMPVRLPRIRQERQLPAQHADDRRVRAVFPRIREAAIFHFARTVAKPEDRHAWSRELHPSSSTSNGKSFSPARSKRSCCHGQLRPLRGMRGERERNARNRSWAGPAPEAMGMDVFSTVLKAGYPIEVLSDYGQTMNRYAFLLIE